MQQKLDGYNRESGKKTLRFVALLITIIAVLAITAILAVNGVIVL